MQSRQTKIYSLLIISLTLLLVGAFTYSTNIHGDGQYHSVVSQLVVENGWPISEHPFIVMSFDDADQPIQAPINYPEAVYLIYASLQLIGGGWLLQASSPIFAALAAWLIFLTLRKVNTRLALLAALLAIVLSLKRFIMSPIIEQPMLAAMMASIYFFIRWLDSRQWKWAIVAGIFGGLAMSLKQQGLLLLPVFALMPILSFLQSKFRPQFNKIIIQGLVLIAVMLVVTLPFQIEHFSRNGTIGYVPGSGTSGVLDKLPFYEQLTNNKYPADEEARAIQSDRLGYLRTYPSLSTTFLAYLSFPLTYDNELPIGRWNIVGALIVLVLVLTGAIILLRRHFLLGFTVVTIFLAEIIFTYITDTAIWQYHILGVSLLAMLIVMGAGYLLELFLVKHRHIVLRIAMIMVLLLGFSNSFVNNLHQPYFGNSGRQDDASLVAYEELGVFVQDNVATDDIVVTAETNFVAYAGRQRYWISNGGGAHIPEIFDTSDVTRSYELLKTYPVDYVLIDEQQSSRKGLYDSISPNGLTLTIDSVEGKLYFEQLFLTSRPDGDALRFYRIRPEPLKTSEL